MSQELYPKAVITVTDMMKRYILVRNCLLGRLVYSFLLF